MIVLELSGSDTLDCLQCFSHVGLVPPYLGVSAFYIGRVSELSPNGNIACGDNATVAMRLITIYGKRKWLFFGRAVAGEYGQRVT